MPTPQPGPIARQAHGRFAKGWRGGPGRPRGGLIDYARSRSDDGRILVDHAVQIVSEGKIVRTDEVTGEEWVQTATLKDQAVAREWLGSIGLAVRATANFQLVSTTDSNDWKNYDFSDFSIEELRQFDALVSKARRRLPEAVDGEILERIPSLPEVAQ